MSMSFFDLGQRSLGFQTEFFCSRKNILYETKYHLKNFRGTGKKIYTTGLGHMNNMVAMPIYGKKPCKIFSSRISEPIEMNFSKWH